MDLTISFSLVNDLVIVIFCIVDYNKDLLITLSSRLLYIILSIGGKQH